MPYKISEHKPADVICQCGAIVKYNRMHNHLLSTEHARDMIGREHIEIADTYMYIYT
jgi:hypothetical protein